MTLEDLPVFAIYDLEHDDTSVWTEKKRVTLLQCLIVCIPSSGFNFFSVYVYCPGPNNYRHLDLTFRS